MSCPASYNTGLTNSLGLNPSFLTINYNSREYEFIRTTLKLSIEPEKQQITVEGLVSDGNYEKLYLSGGGGWTYWQEDLPGKDFRFYDTFHDLAETDFAERKEVTQDFAALVWALEYAADQRADGIRAYSDPYRVTRSDYIADGMFYRVLHWGESAPCIMNPSGRSISLLMDRVEPAATFISDSAGTAAPNNFTIRASRMIYINGRLEWWVVLNGRVVRFWSTDGDHPTVEGNSYFFCQNQDKISYEVMVDLGNGNAVELPYIYMNDPDDSKPSFWYTVSTSLKSPYYRAVVWNEGGGQYDAEIIVSNAGGFTNNGYTSHVRRAPNGDVIGMNTTGAGGNLSYWLYDGSSDINLIGSYTVKEIVDSVGMAKTAISGDGTEVQLKGWVSAELVPIVKHGHYQIITEAQVSGGNVALVLISHNGGVSATEGENWDVVVLVENWELSGYDSEPMGNGDGLNVRYALWSSADKMVQFDFDSMNPIIYPVNLGKKKGGSPYIESPGIFRNDGSNFFYRDWDVFTPYTGTPQAL